MKNIEQKIRNEEVEGMVKKKGTSGKIQHIFFVFDSIVVRFYVSKQYRRNIEEESKQYRTKPEKGPSLRWR
ncbi:hypothetical protein SY85_21110 [Flavisolibacter tropicus]|uniref:Uncharacterized protein n=1 Tax=Flavisolibacter tropicus TaxID=1492898 RepID=A0A172U0T4_9BACT|nr:hypothetical protein SY85_21110 [Flavisolibacter tropicus]